MYDRFLKSTEVRDVRVLFQRLQARSRDAHLPAFERCVARVEKRGQGQTAALRKVHKLVTVRHDNVGKRDVT